MFMAEPISGSSQSSVTCRELTSTRLLQTEGEQIFAHDIEQAVSGFTGVVASVAMLLPDSSQSSSETSVILFVEVADAHFAHMEGSDMKGNVMQLLEKVEPP